MANMNEVKKPRKPLIFYYGIVLLVIILFNSFIDEFQINFLSQTFYGDEIKVYKKKTDYGIFIEGKHNGIAVFNCFVISAKAQ